MPKIKEDKKQDKVLTPEEQLGNYLKENKDDHFAFEDEIDYKVSSGSLILDQETGGIPPGIARLIGGRENGKSSVALSYMQNFLKHPNIERCRAIYFKSEGRLSKDMRSRYDINFVDKIDDWKDNTCYILDTNVYEAVIELMRTLVKNNPTKTNYFFVIDSVDALCLKDDLKKSFSECDKVAGGALLSSKFLQKMALAMSKLGHIVLMISQERSFIKLDPRQKVPQRQGDSSAGNAVQHYANWVFNFKTRVKDDLILDKNEKIVGHKCTIEILKSTNEKTFTKVCYKVKYGQKCGNSIWKEWEVIDLLLMWSQAKRSGKWFSLSDEIIKDIDKAFENKINIPEQFDGEAAFFKFFEMNPEITEFLYNKFKAIIHPQPL